MCDIKLLCVCEPRSCDEGTDVSAASGISLL